ACDFIDVNQYTTLFPRIEDPMISRLRINSSYLINCLQKDKNIKVIVDAFFLAIADEELKKYVFNLDAERLVYLTD
ncbi:MAG: hypothetical protein HQK51_06710, partial [Oligoflexia bacterium]|nr:hypothetical protein [Oligoflexia bacterium]